MHSYPHVEIEKYDGGHGQDNRIKNVTGKSNVSNSFAWTDISYETN